MRVHETLKEIEETCNKYGFWDNKVIPYGFGIEVRSLFNNWKDYDNCTYDSRAVIRDEIKGFLPILRSWVEYENEPMIKVRIIKGEHIGQEKEYHKSLADILIESETAIAR